MSRIQNFINGYKLAFSKGDSNILSLLQKYSKVRSVCARMTKGVLKKIEKISHEIILKGLPSHLCLAHVNDQVSLGVFLRKTAPSIAEGDVIGIYSGLYELVLEKKANQNAYAYDVVQEIHLTKKHIFHIFIYM